MGWIHSNLKVPGRPECSGLIPDPRTSHQLRSCLILFRHEPKCKFRRIASVRHPHRHIPLFSPRPNGFLPFESPHSHTSNTVKISLSKLGSERRRSLRYFDSTFVGGLFAAPLPQSPPLIRTSQRLSALSSLKSETPLGTRRSFPSFLLPLDLETPAHPPSLALSVSGRVSSLNLGPLWSFHSLSSRHVPSRSDGREDATYERDEGAAEGEMDQLRTG